MAAPVPSISNSEDEYSENEYSDSENEYSDSENEYQNYTTTQDPIVKYISEEHMSYLKRMLYLEYKYPHECLCDALLQFPCTPHNCSYGKFPPCMGIDVMRCREMLHDILFDPDTLGLDALDREYLEILGYIPVELFERLDVIIYLFEDDLKPVLLALSKARKDNDSTLVQEHTLKVLDILYHYYYEKDDDIEPSAQNKGDVN